MKISAVLEDMQPELGEKGKDFTKFKIRFGNPHFNEGDLIDYDKYNGRSDIRVADSGEMREDGSCVYTLHLYTNDPACFVNSRYFSPGTYFFIRRNG